MTPTQLTEQLTSDLINERHVLLDTIANLQQVLEAQTAVIAEQAAHIRQLENDAHGERTATLEHVELLTEHLLAAPAAPHGQPASSKRWITRLLG